jgi:hypothetical protein
MQDVAQTIVKSVLAKLVLVKSDLKGMSIIKLQASVICYLLNFKISMLLSLGNNARCRSNNSAVCAGKVGIGIVRTKKNEHNKVTRFTNLLPFGLLNLNIKLSLG